MLRGRSWDRSQSRLEQASSQRGREKQGGLAEDGARARLHHGDGHRQPPAVELEGGEWKIGDSKREREPGWRVPPGPSPFCGRRAEAPRFRHTDALPRASEPGKEQVKAKPRQTCRHKHPSWEGGTELSAAGMPHAGTAQARCGTRLRDAFTREMTGGWMITWVQTLFGIHLLSTPRSTNSPGTHTLREERRH